MSERGTTLRISAVLRAIYGDSTVGYPIVHNYPAGRAE